MTLEKCKSFLNLIVKRKSSAIILFQEVLIDEWYIQFKRFRGVLKFKTFSEKGFNRFQPIGILKIL